MTIWQSGGGMGGSSKGTWLGVLYCHIGYRILLNICLVGQMQVVSEEKGGGREEEHLLCFSA